MAKHLVRRNKTYRRFWYGRAGSGLGDWFNQVALAQVILGITHSPAAMGFVLLCRDLPQAAASLIIGPFIDRHSKRAIMIWVDAASAAVILLFIWGAVCQLIWVFFAGSVLLGLASALRSPAQNAAIPSIVTPQDLTEANTWTISTSGALAIFGAALGGTISTFFHPWIAFFINALSYLWSAGWLLATRWKETGLNAVNDHSLASYKTELREGFRVLKEKKLLRVLITTGMAFALTAGPYFILIPVLGDLTYHLAGIGIGLLYVADGLAFIASAWIVNHLVKRSLPRSYLWYGIGFFIQAVFFAAFSFSVNVWTGMTFIFLAQLGSGILMSLEMTLLQRLAPPTVRGRVFAINDTLYRSTSQLSLLLAGPAISLLGAPSIGIVVGVIGIFASIRWLRESKSANRISNRGLSEN